MRADEQILFTAGNAPLRCGRAIWFRRDDIKLASRRAGFNRRGCHDCRAMGVARQRARGRNADRVLDRRRRMLRPPGWRAEFARLAAAWREELPGERSSKRDSWRDRWSSIDSRKAMIVQPYQLYMERIDPAKNMARFYAMSI